MKMKNNITVRVLLAVVLLTIVGCNDMLNEKPRTVFTTEYFKTAAGLTSAINASYAGLRYDFGPNGALAITNVGTDEWTYGDQPATGQDNGVLQLGTYKITTDDGSILTPWNNNYWHINNCNAVIDFSTTVDMPEGTKNTLLAEAHCLRAIYYLLLVQQFGAVPLDLGSGELKYNTDPTTEFHRLPVDELLTKNYQEMIDDLTFASENLPDARPVAAFKLSKAMALHTLAKVYLFRAYSSVKQATDFQSAYTTAMKLIDNKATYGLDLLADYGDVHKGGNDYNKEIIFSVERMSQNNSANEVSNPGSDFSNKVNIANNMFNCNYQSAVKISNVSLFANRPLQYGRPLRRYCPTKWLLETAFKDRKNDSRFDNSFRMVWKAATLDASGTAAYTTYVNSLTPLGIALGDTVIYLTATDHIADSLKALSGAQKKKYYIAGPKDFYSPQNTAITLYPNLKKYDDQNRAAPNDVSGRPFIVSKFSETYLIAAEAAMQAGHPTDAIALINTLKLRAAYRPGLDPSVISGRYDLIKVNSPSDITLDFILDERTRELCGESLRWPDLAVRGKLVERVKAFNVEGAPNIKDFHVLRPIPQSQLNAVSDPDKAKYQNPGY